HSIFCAPDGASEISLISYGFMFFLFFPVIPVYPLRNDLQGPYKPGAEELRVFLCAQVRGSAHTKPERGAEMCTKCAQTQKWAAFRAG
ncbi:MAG: hypothetical protein IJJ24_10080, partial [Solobacterium sp.]|nr:hypothetical protein [Solobacterium sp.]